MFSRHLTAALVFAAVSIYLVAPMPVSAAEDDPVVATGDGFEIHLSHVKEALALLPHLYQRVPFETILPGLVDSLIDSRLAAEDARSQNLHDTPKFKAQMVRIEEQILLVIRPLHEQLNQGVLIGHSARHQRSRSGPHLRAREVIAFAEALCPQLREPVSKCPQAIAIGEQNHRLVARCTTCPVACPLYQRVILTGMA